MNKEMYTGSQVNHRILLWCSPGFGMIDVWLPVIRKLKEKSNIKIDFVFPEPSSLHLEDKDSDLFRLSEQFSDSIIYKGYSERWFIVNTLIEAKAGICFNSFDEKISHLAVRLLRGKMSRFFFLKALGRYILTIVKYFIRFKEFLTGNSLYDFKLSDDVAGILCDIIKEHKSANKELRSKFKDIHKFSMLHGIAASWLMDEFICEKPVITNRSDVTVYNMSHLEVDGYKKCFGILDKNLVHAGIPRHDKDWIEFVYNQSVFSKNRTFDSFVFVIGRPASPYNTPERKKNALKDIYNIICIKHKLKIVVKLHPKESKHGLDHDIYNDAFGVENYGKSWIYSDAHVFVLGSKAIFAISFFSGVINDMLAINKPSIEYLNLDGLKLYDNVDSLRDKSGNPVFQYRYAQLVLGAGSKLELELHVESIINKYKETFSSLYLKYKDYYNPYENSSDMVSNDIINKVGEK